MRHLICLLCVTGCVAMSLPADNNGVTADLACETASMVMRLRQEILPAPASDKCERCDGQGVLGDRAKISIKCPDCDGTGRKPVSVCKDCAQ